MIKYAVLLLLYKEMKLSIAFSGKMLYFCGLFCLSMTRPHSYGYKRNKI